MSSNILLILAVVALGIVFIVWATNVSIRREMEEMEKKHEDTDLPYKLEPAEDVAVPEKPKRKYTKRGKYWTTARKKKAAKKAVKRKSV